MPQATVNELKKMVKRNASRIQFLAPENGKFSTTVHGKRSLRNCVAIIPPPVPMSKEETGICDNILPKWFRVDVTKWLRGYPISFESRHFYEPDFVLGRPIYFHNRENKYTAQTYKGEEHTARLVKDVFYDRSGGMALVGHVDDRRIVLYPYIYFHNEIDAMYFVVDHGLTTK